MLYCASIGMLYWHALSIALLLACSIGMLYCASIGVLYCASIRVPYCGERASIPLARGVSGRDTSTGSLRWVKSPKILPFLGGSPLNFSQVLRLPVEC